MEEKTSSLQQVLMALLLPLYSTPLLPPPKANGLLPFDYLKLLFEKIPLYYADEDFYALLPLIELICNTVIRRSLTIKG